MIKKTLVHFLLLFVLIWLFPIISRAETSFVTDIDVTLYSNDNGIPTGEANTVLQTRDGYIWVGGYGGLQRFDGADFEMFSGKAGLSSYSIRSLYEDRDGRLWVGSNEQGVFCYNGHEFLKPAADTDSRFLSVRSITQDESGIIWLGTTDGLALIEDGRITAFDLAGFDYSNSTVYTLSKDSSGRIWAVDNYGAVLLIDPISRKLLRIFTPGIDWPEGVYAYSALAARDDSVYIGTGSKVLLHLIPSGEYYNLESIGTASLQSVNSLIEKEDGSIWVGGDSGIGVLTGTGFQECSFIQNASHIVCITGDYEQNLWAASSKYGILHIRRVKVSRLTQAPKLDDKETYTVLPYRGKYYVGTENGLHVFSSRWEPEVSPLALTLSGKYVHQILEGSDGKLYLGTFFNGLYIYDGDTEIIRNIDVSNSRIRALLNLSDGRLAVATDIGIDILNGDVIEESYETGIMVLCMQEMPDGSLLLGTNGSGILMLKDRQITPYADEKKGLAGGVILRMRFDEADPSLLWVSCGNDLLYGNDSGFTKTASLEDGDGSILDIFTDGDKIWLFRSSGILAAKRSDLMDSSLTSISSDFYSRYDGIPGAITANSWSLFDGDTFTITTTNGIGLLNKNVSKYSITPKCAISSVTLSDGSLWDGSDTLNLSKDLTRISIRLAALTYVGKNAWVEYWLEGLDEKPILRPAGELHEVEYTSLDAGSYIFHFNVINSDGLRGKEITLKLTKAPKFTETVWFPILLFGGIALLILLISILRIYQLRKKKEEYRQMTDQTIAVISGAIDAKDPYTEGHSKRVAEFAEKIGKKLNLSKDDLERLHYVALLHDIGKIGVPDSILKKPGRLDPEEYETIKLHTTAGGDILKNLTMIPGAEEGAEYHHERYDGSGYCHHLKGKDIPLFARIISVADSYDAMSSSRCYRKALDRDVVISELEKGKGTQFDPDLADLAIEILNEEKKEAVKQTASE